MSFGFAAQGFSNGRLRCNDCSARACAGNRFRHRGVQFLPSLVHSQGRFFARTLANEPKALLRALSLQ
jgi:hypothetical protein